MQLSDTVVSKKHFPIFTLDIWGDKNYLTETDS